MKLNGTKELYELLGLSITEIIPQMETYIEALGLSQQMKPSIDIKSTLREVNLQRLGNNPIDVTTEKIRELEEYLRTKIMV